MRSKLPQCARLVAVVVFAAACSSSRSVQTSHRQVPVIITATCSTNQVKLAIDSSTVQFHHTSSVNPSTDVEWTLGSGSNVNVTITPDAAWPFDGTPPFPVQNGTPYKAVGKATQAKGHYRYSVTVVCPNGGPTAIFDPDIWVD